MGSARCIIRLNHGVMIFILVIGIKTVIISILPAIRTLVIGLMLIRRVKDIILHLPVLFVMVISAITILTDTVNLRLTKSKFTPANVRMISATDWVNSSSLKKKFIKGCFMMVNTSVHLRRTEVRCYQKPGLHFPYS